MKKLNLTHNAIKQNKLHILTVFYMSLSVTVQAQHVPQKPTRNLHQGNAQSLRKEHHTFILHKGTVVLQQQQQNKKPKVTEKMSRQGCHMYKTAIGQQEDYQAIDLPSSTDQQHQEDNFRTVINQNPRKRLKTYDSARRKQNSQERCLPPKSEQRYREYHAQLVAQMTPQQNLHQDNAWSLGNRSQTFILQKGTTVQQECQNNQQKVMNNQLQEKQSFHDRTNLRPIVPRKLFTHGCRNELKKPLPKLAVVQPRRKLGNVLRRDPHNIPESRRGRHVPLSNGPREELAPRGPLFAPSSTSTPTYRQTPYQ